MEPIEQNDNMNQFDEKSYVGQRTVRASDPDTYSNPESARVRARQIGCIGIRRYNNTDGSVSWMPCTNESDYRKYSGQGFSGRKFRRQQIQQEIRNEIGQNYGRSFRKKSANYTNPELRETIKKRILAGSKGGRPGQWSARKAQLVAIAYKKAGGGYKGGKNKKQRSIVRWGKEKWRTSDGKPAIRGSVTRRYLPAKAWQKLTPAQRAATNRKKIAGSKKGRQFVANTENAAKARKRVSRGIKHIEFYEELEVKAIGTRVGGRLGRALAPGDGGSGPRKGRVVRRSRMTRAMLNAPFDPDPIDADADLQVQEGTRWERTITPEASLASRLGRGAVPMPKRTSSNKPTQRNIARGAGRPAPKIRRIQKLRTQTAPKKPLITEREKPLAPKRTAAKPTRTPITPSFEPTLASQERQEEVRRSFDDLGSILNRAEKVDIYKAWDSGRYTVLELANQFDVVEDEISSVLTEHKKYRDSSYRLFKKNNPKLFSAIELKMSKNKNDIQEAIRDGIVKNWDSLLGYAMRSPGRRTEKDKIINELFEVFPRGTDPDGKSGSILGFRRTKRRGIETMVRDMANRESMPSDFVPANEYRRTATTIDSRATSPRDLNERATRAREFRKYQRQADSLRTWDSSISGRMSAGPPMTPEEENSWRMREWKRQQLKKLALSPELGSGKFDTLAQIVGNGDLAIGINSIDELDDSLLDSTWDSTIQDLLKSGKSIPAFRAKNAPFTPKELAVAANAKRPLVKTFLDEVKKLNPSGNFSKVDFDSLSDKDIDDFFNTFILPELTNPDAPTTQDIQNVAGLPQSRELIDIADSVSWLVPNKFKDLELRTLIARQRLKESGMSTSDPDFDRAVEQLIEDDYASEVDSIEKWLAAGAPQTGSSGGGGVNPPPPINPATGEPFDKDKWVEMLNDLQNQMGEEMGSIREKYIQLWNDLVQIGREQGWINDDDPGDDEMGADEDSFGTQPEQPSSIDDEFGYPDTDEAWNLPYVDEAGNEIPYDGSSTHPLNVNPETGVPYSIEEEQQMDEDLYRFFLDPNNMHVREWMDLDNTHTIGRYTKPPAELASRFYQGDIDDPNPEKIDQRIQWDRLIDYIQKVAPSYFTEDPNGNLVADMAEIMRNGNYDGASFNLAPDPDADSSGYQLRSQLLDYVKLKTEEEAKELASSSAAGKTRRAALWNLFETGTLTPEEIAFDEDLFDVKNVNAALAQHALENNISKSQFKSLMSIARAAEPSRTDSYAKRRVEKIVQQFQNQGKSSRMALQEIDRAIEHQIELKTRVGIEYDQMRARYMALRNMITSMLMMRPKNRKQTYNRDGSVERKGWEPKNESASRYLNRMNRWDRQFIGRIGPDGKFEPGIVSILVTQLRRMEIQTGAVAGGGATSDISRTADQNIERLKEMRDLINEARGDAKKFGVSGMMTAGGANSRILGRAEENAKNSARRAASGHFMFASPRNLKRYDDFGLPISKQTRVSASGFNKKLTELVAEATRSKNFKWSNSPYFNTLPENLKDIVRGLDETPYTFSRRGFRAMFPKRKARKGRTASESIVKDSDYDAFELLPPRVFFKNTTKITPRKITGSMRLYTDEFEGKWHITDRYGDKLIDRAFDSHEEALEFANSNQRDYDSVRDFPLTDQIRFDAYKKRIDIFPYTGDKRIREVAKEMTSDWVENQAQKPKRTAADSVIFRTNQETGELEVAMIRRLFPPFSGEKEVNLPGGFVELSDLDDGETEINKDVFVRVAMREQLEEVGIKPEDVVRSEFIGEFDEPDWDPRFPNGIRVGGVFFEVKPETELVAGDDAQKAFWVPVEKLSRGQLGIGFGHAGFISAMLWDDEPEFAEKLAIISQLARRRNQRIIKEVNEARAIKNTARTAENQIPLFPSNLPNPDIGFQPGGPEAVERARATFRRLTGRMSGTPYIPTRETRGQLTDRVRYALVNYSGNGSLILNQLLRETDGKILDRDFVKDRESLRDSLTDNSASGLATRISLGTQTSFEKLLLELEPYVEMNDWLKAGSIPNGTILYRSLGNENILSDLSVGDEFFDGAFQSTTLDPDNKNLLNTPSLRIFVGEGVSGRELTQGIDAPRYDEREVILPAGARYKILRTPTGPNPDTSWDVEIVGQGVSGAMRTDSRYTSNMFNKFNLNNDDRSEIGKSIRRAVTGQMSIGRQNYVGRDFYSDLDLPTNATLKEIKEQFKRISRLFSPDRNPGDKAAKERFERAEEAYSVLSNGIERDYYDTTLLPNVLKDRTAQIANPSTRPSSPPQRPRVMGDVAGPEKPAKPLPKLKNELASRLGYKVEIPKNIIPGHSSLDRYRVTDGGISVQGPSGRNINMNEDRFWNVHYAIAKAITDNVTKKRPANQKKKYYVVGGPPASGKSMLRNDGKSLIPRPNEAAHIDSDEIKELIPEAIISHSMNNPDWASVVHDESRMINQTAVRVAMENNVDIVHDSLGQFIEGFDTLENAREQGYEIVAHYVVVPEDVMEERLNEREKIDPRRIPRHVAYAALNNNLRRMVDVAEFADEFYLYDGDSPDRKIIVRKLPNQAIEILDAKAFDYGYFEQLDVVSNFFENPSTAGRFKETARNTQFAKIIRAFDSGKTVTEVAQEFRMSRRQVHDLVKTTSVNENITEATPVIPSRFYGQDSLFDDMGGTDWPASSRGNDYYQDDFGSIYEFDNDTPNLYEEAEEIGRQIAFEEAIETTLNDILDEFSPSPESRENRKAIFKYLEQSLTGKFNPPREAQEKYLTETMQLSANNLSDLRAQSARYLNLLSTPKDILNNPINTQAERWEAAYAIVRNVLEGQDFIEYDYAVEQLAEEFNQLLDSDGNTVIDGADTPALRLEIAMLSDQAALPYWVTRSMVEKTKSDNDNFDIEWDERNGNGVSGNMSTGGFVRPTPNIPSKNITEKDVTVINYPDSEVPALKLPVIDEIISIIHPDNPKKSSNPDLQNQDMDYLNYLKGIKYPTEEQRKQILKYIASEKKRLAGVVSGWKFVSPDGIELSTNPKDFFGDIDYFDVTASDGTLLFRVNKLQGLTQFNERHNVSRPENPIFGAQEVTPDSLLAEVFQALNDRDFDMKDDDSLDRAMRPAFGMRVDPPFANTNDVKMFAQRNGHDPSKKFARDIFSGVELIFGNSEKARFVESQIKKSREIQELNSEFARLLAEHFGDLREQMRLARYGSGAVNAGINDSIIDFRNREHGPKTESPYDIGTYVYSYTGFDPFLPAHEMFHNAGGQGFDRHGDHTANRMMKFVFPNHYNIVFNYITRSQDFTDDLSDLPLWLTIPEDMMNPPER